MPAVSGVAFDGETAEWTRRVLAGELRHPFPPQDPEALHDACRLRGVLAQLCDVMPPEATDRLASDIRALVGYAVALCGRLPVVGWDPTTSALRLVNLLVAADHLEARGRSLLACGEWVEPFLRAHTIPLVVGRLAEPEGNHRLLNAAGSAAHTLLLSPGAPLPPRSARALAAEAARQFLMDGGHRERVPHYHLQILAVLDTIRRADERRGGEVGRHLRPVLEPALAALESMLGPTGEPYRAGDLGRTFSGHVPAREVRDLVRLGDASPGPATDILPEFGVARATWAGRGQSCLLAECGATGLPRTRGHGHADTQAFCYYVDDCEVVADPGTFLYADSAEAVWFRCPEAHAVVRWPRHPRAVPQRFFRWSRLPPEGRIRRDVQTGDPDALFGSAAWWRIWGREFRHTRLWCRDQRGLMVRDELDVSRPVEAELRFVLGPEVTVTDLAGRRAVVRARGRSIEFRVDGTEVGAGRTEAAWYARRYGAREDTTALVWPLSGAKRSRVESRISTLA
jgi:hypothetical protein